MKTSLVGYTGFVGGNLASQHAFDNLYNSANVGTAFGADNGLVVYSGMPAEKFLANADPGADYAVAQNAMENIRQMKPEQLVLISTVDVYPRPVRVYEDTPVTDEDNTHASDSFARGAGSSPGAGADKIPSGFSICGGEAAPAYGRNRLALEGWVRQEYSDALIVRLPGLFGQGLKKNFIYDLLTVTPSALTEAKYEELAGAQPLVRNSYAPDGAGFWRLQPLDADKKAQLRDWFEQNDFNALCFTDSRSVFQFYDLGMLWADIKRCQKLGLRLVNLATQPVEAGALYHHLFGREFENHTAKGPVHYDMRTRYGREFGADDDYIADRNGVVAGIARFVAAQAGRL